MLFLFVVYVSLVSFSCRVGVSNISGIVRRERERERMFHSFSSFHGSDANLGISWIVFAFYVSGENPGEIPAKRQCILPCQRRIGCLRVCVCMCVCALNIKPNFEFEMHDNSDVMFVKVYENYLLSLTVIFMLCSLYFFSPHLIWCCVWIMRCLNYKHKLLLGGPGLIYTAFMTLMYIVIMPNKLNWIEFNCS